MCVHISGVFKKALCISGCIIALLLSGCGVTAENVQSEKTDAKDASKEEITLQEEPSDGTHWTGGDTSMLTVLQETEEYTVYELCFARNGMQIYGNLYLPNKAQETYPTVIIGHGFGGSYSEMAVYAQALAKSGFAGYVFDFCGGAGYSRSDGDTMNMSVLTEEQDMEAVMAGLKDFSFIDQNNLFLMGESQGGLVASLLGVRRISEVRGLILLYPAYVIPDDAREEYPEREDIPETGNRFGITVGRDYFEDVWDMDVYQEISGFDKSVLIIHGSADSVVPISYSQQAAETFSDAELVILDGAGHGFYRAEQEKAAEEIIHFLQEEITDSVE